MQTLKVDGVKIRGVYSCLPTASVDNLKRCIELYGDEKKALSVVRATGINSLRIADSGVTSLDLCVCAAEGLLRDLKVSETDIGAIVCVTFTPERQMPCNACQAQRRLGLPADIVAFDIGLACSGYAYGLYVAGMLVKATGKNVLLLDGDVQSAVTNADDTATVPVLGDAGTATMLAPSQADSCWKFSFLSCGAGGEALTLDRGGTISMDGFAVFKFVAMDVARFIKDFMNAEGIAAETIDAFIPHQANVYMIKQLTKSLKIPDDKLWISGDKVGNSASATVPVTISRCAVGGFSGRNVLISGFGGGLSASVANIDFPPECLFVCHNYGNGEEIPHG